MIHTSIKSGLVPLIIGFAITAISSIGAVQGQGDDNWPQWRGPHRNGIAETKPTLDRWPAQGPKQLWVSSEGGLGYSGFAVVEGRLFTMGQENNRQFVVCLDAETGSQIWLTETGRGYENDFGGGPRSTPTIDDEFLFALDANGVLVCLRTDSGREVWKTDLKQYGGEIPSWGYSESVLIDGDQLICTPGGMQGAIMAFDKHSGEKKWQMSGNTEVAHYSSISKADIQGSPQYIQLMNKSILGVAPNGELLWSSDWPGAYAVIPSPIIHENKVYVTSGYGIGSKQIEIQPENEVEFKWFNKVMKNHHGGAILLDGHVYGYSDSVGWICQDWQSGEIVWRNRNDLGKGAIGYGDGKFICVAEDSGEIVMIKADSSGWDELGRFTLEPQTERRKPSGKIWVHPVVVNGRLYLRDQELIHCYDIRADE